MASAWLASTRAVGTMNARMQDEMLRPSACIYNQRYRALYTQRIEDTDALKMNRAYSQDETFPGETTLL